MGLVNRVLPDAELDAFVADWAGRLAAGPPIALAMTKRLLNNSFNVTLEEALDDEGLSQTVNFGDEGHGRGGAWRSWRSGRPLSGVADPRQARTRLRVQPASAVVFVSLACVTRRWLAPCIGALAVIWLGTAAERCRPPSAA